MHPHHAQTIERLVAELKKDATIRAVLLGGSLAHGFARADSDVDVLIVIDPVSYRERKRAGRINYFNTDICTYDGYVDGKYIDLPFLESVAERGSDPARFAFQDAVVLYSTIPDIESFIADVVRYPVEKKDERIRRFAAQVLAWEWYYGEAQRHGNRYLSGVALHKLLLFGSRIVLAINETFYPYHKWLLTVLERTAHKPDSLLADMDRLLSSDTADGVAAYADSILSFAGVDRSTIDWGGRFVTDSELNWIDGDPPIDDM